MRSVPGRALVTAVAGGAAPGNGGDSLAPARFPSPLALGGKESGERKNDFMVISCVSSGWE